MLVEADNFALICAVAEAGMTMNAVARSGARRIPDPAVVKTTREFVARALKTFEETDVETITFADDRMSLIPPSLPAEAKVTCASPNARAVLMRFEIDRTATFVDVDKFLTADNDGFDAKMTLVDVERFFVEADKDADAIALNTTDAVDVSLRIGPNEVVDVKTTLVEVCIRRVTVARGLDATMMFAKACRRRVVIALAIALKTMLVVEESLRTPPRFVAAAKTTLAEACRRWIDPFVAEVLMTMLAVDDSLRTTFARGAAEMTMLAVAIAFLRTDEFGEAVKITLADVESFRV